MRKGKFLLATIVISASLNMTALAGQWIQEDTNWRYQNNDGTYSTKTWQNVDGKTYLFDSNGYMRTGWIQTEKGNWYYLNLSGEIRYEDLTENGVTYHFDAQGICTNPYESDINPDTDYQSIADQERLEAGRRLLDQPSSEEAYEEEVKYYHDVNPQPIENRYGLSDMQF